MAVVVVVVVAVGVGVAVVKITLPWPPAALSPNSRCHWSVKAKAVKSYRLACCGLALQAHGPISPWPTPGPIRIGWTFFPPRNSRYDQDGLVSRMKSGLDGLADALRVDDHRFVLGAPVIAPARFPGRVEVSVE